MKKLFFTVTVLLLCCTVSFSQRKLNSSTMTINWAPLSSPSCTFYVDVYMVSEDGISYFATPTQTVSFTGSTASSASLTFTAPVGSTGFVPGDYYVHVYSTGQNFSVNSAGFSTTPGTITVPGVCNTTSNCSTDWMRVNTNTFTLRPKCTVGGID